MARVRPISGQVAQALDVTSFDLTSAVYAMSTISSHLAKECGYSCQPWLGVNIADRYFGSSYLTWFSTTINPPQNGDSSNPLRLYEELDRIVKTNDYNHSRVDQLKRR